MVMEVQFRAYGRVVTTEHKTPLAVKSAFSILSTNQPSIPLDSSMRLPESLVRDSWKHTFKSGRNKPIRKYLSEGSKAVPVTSFWH